MNELYIVYAMHRESPWCDGMSWIGQSYILKTYAQADLLAKILQSIEKDRDITWEILETEDSIHIDINDKISLNEYKTKLIINPGKIDDKVVRKQVSITKGELEVLEDWEELPDNTYEDAIVNGIIKQIKLKKKENK